MYFSEAYIKTLKMLNKLDFNIYIVKLYLCEL